MHPNRWWSATRSLRPVTPAKCVSFQSCPVLSHLLLDRIHFIMLLSVKTETDSLVYHIGVTCGREFWESFSLFSEWHGRHWQPDEGKWLSGEGGAPVMWGESTVATGFTVDRDGGVCGPAPQLVSHAHTRTFFGGSKFWVHLVSP